MLTLTTSQGTFFIRPFCAGDEQKILSLFKEVFNQEKSLALWQWEFLKNPYGTQIMLCEQENGKLVAQCASIPVPLFFKEKTYLGAQLVDCMCKKEYRAFGVKKKGLFALTVEEFFAAFTGKDKDIYLFGFPGERHFRLGKLLLGYRETRPIIETKISALKKDLKTHFFSLTTFNKQDIIKHSPQLEKLALQDARMLKFCVLREPKYLLWRYIDCPRNYNILALKNILGKLKGLCILQVEREELKLIDFLGINYLKEMLILIWKAFNLPIKMWLPKKSLAEEILIPLGAVFNKPALPVIAGGKSFWEGLNWDWANRHFFYTMGDCDLF